MLEVALNWKELNRLILKDRCGYQHIINIELAALKNVVVMQLKLVDIYIYTCNYRI